MCSGGAAGGAGGGEASQGGVAGRGGRRGDHRALHQLECGPATHVAEALAPGDQGPRGPRPTHKHARGALRQGASSEDLSKALDVALELAPDAAIERAREAAQKLV